MTDTPGQTPDIEVVISRGLQHPRLTLVERQSIAAALRARVQTNLARDPDRVVDLETFEEGIRDIAEQAVLGRQLTEPPSQLSVSQANFLINGLCERFDLPWPICPADD